jgi:hypothetical protein
VLAPLPFVRGRNWLRVRWFLRPGIFLCQTLDFCLPHEDSGELGLSTYTVVMKDVILSGKRLCSQEPAGHDVRKVRSGLITSKLQRGRAICQDACNCVVQNLLRFDRYFFQLYEGVEVRKGGRGPARACDKQSSSFALALAARLPLVSVKLTVLNSLQNGSGRTSEPWKPFATAGTAHNPISVSLL